MSVNGASVRKVAATVTASGTLAKGKHNPVDAGLGNLTMTLPTGANEGSFISVEKVDAGANTVTLSGSIRGSAGTFVLSGQFQSVDLVADAAGSWHIPADHKPFAITDARVQRGGAYYQYVDYGRGNDSNDGKSWGKAKKTLSAAKAALPLGGSGNRLGILMLADGVHHYGASLSSATGFNQDSGLNIIGIGRLAGSQGGTQFVYDGTGTGWQTGKDATSVFAGTTLINVQFIGTGSAGIGVADTLLDIHNAQNDCTIEGVLVGDTAVGVSNPVSSALKVSVDASLAGAYPGFIHFRDCWFTGGSTPISVTAGVTGINFTNCGSDLLDDAQIGFRVLSSTNDAKCTIRWISSKQEIHNGPNTPPTPTLVLDSTAGQIDAGAHQYRYTYVTPAGESGLSLAAAAVTNDGTHTKTTLTVPLPANAIADRLTQRKVYRNTVATPTVFKLLTTISGGITTTYTDTTPDASLGATYAAPAMGAVGAPYAIQIDALCRFVIDSEAFYDAMVPGAAINYTATPSGPAWPRGKYDLSSLNCAAHIRAPGTLLGATGTIPKTLIPENTAHLSGMDFLRGYVARDIVFGGRSPGSVTSPTGLGTGGTAVLTSAATVFNSTDRSGQLTITIGTTPPANPTVALAFADNSIGNGGPKILLTPATSSGGTTSPVDVVNWQVDYSGTTAAGFKLKWGGAAAPTAGNVYYLNYVVLA